MVTQKTEKIYDFALQLPKGYVLGSAEKASDTLVKIEFSWQQFNHKTRTKHWYNAHTCIAKGE